MHAQSALNFMGNQVFAKIMKILLLYECVYVAYRVLADAYLAWHIFLFFFVSVFPLFSPSKK